MAKFSFFAPEVNAGKLRLGPDISLDLQKAQRLHMFLRAIRHPRRQQLLVLIVYNEAMSVNDIATEMDMDTSQLSIDLRMLRDADIVTFDRKGANKMYRINQEKLMESVKYINTLGD